MRRVLSKLMVLTLSLSMVLGCYNLTVWADDETDNSGGSVTDVSNDDESIVASGTDGSIEWKINEDGLLSITGSVAGTTIIGEEEEMPWANYAKLVTSATVDVTDLMSYSFLFADLTNLETVEFVNWNNDVTDTSSMFSGCSSLRNINTENWDVSKVTDMNSMFDGCSALTAISTANWNTSNVTDMSRMFTECTSLEKIDSSGWDTSKVTDMDSMFSECSYLSDLDVSSWDTSSVESMNSMFDGCDSIESLHVEDWNTSKVTDMCNMFYDCYSLKHMDPSKWDTSAVVDMSNMFNGAKSLVSLDLASWNVLKTTDMDSMFLGCTNLTTLDISGWDMTSVTVIDGFIENCRALTTVYAPAMFGASSTESVALPGKEWTNEDGEVVTEISSNLESPMTYIKDRNPSSQEVYRLAGPTRFETSLKIADVLKEDMEEEKFDAVVLAYAHNYPDALAGSYLAINNEAPILLIDNKNANTIANYVYKNLSADGTVYILGSTGVIPTKVANKFSRYETIRLGGTDRYATNLKIIEEAMLDDNLSSTPIIVCSGAGYADSLSASSSGNPILIVDPKKGLTSAQLNFLKKNKADTFIIAGSTGAVPAKVENKLKTMGSVTRLGGKTRYETSAIIADYFTEDETDLMAVLAYGQNFPDGLCAGPLAYQYGAALVLTANKTIGPAQSYMNKYDIQDGFVTGGSSLISDASVRKIFGCDFVEPY